MSLVDRVYCIPARLDQKGSLPEISYLTSYLADEKKFVRRVIDLVVALERLYRHSAQTFATAAESKTPIPPDLPHTSGFVDFRRVRLKQTDRFLEIAARIAALLNGDFAQLKSTFQTSCTQLENELKNLHALVQAPLDGLSASIAGYDKYFKQLVQGHNKPDQALKAIRSLDEKLARVHNNHLTFHRQFVEYCARREGVFFLIETLVKETNARISDLLGIVSEIDGIVLGDLKDLATESPEETKSEVSWPEEEEFTEAQPPFMVQLAQPLNISGSILPVNAQMAVLQSRGRIWTVKDMQRNCTWSIPQDYLVTEEKSK
jgi:hypothetical protein